MSYSSSDDSSFEIESFDDQNDQSDQILDAAAVGATANGSGSDNPLGADATTTTASDINNSLGGEEQVATENNDNNVVVAVADSIVQNEYSGSLISAGGVGFAPEDDFETRFDDDVTGDVEPPIPANASAPSSSSTTGGGRLANADPPAPSSNGTTDKRRPVVQCQGYTKSSGFQKRCARKSSDYHTKGYEECEPLALGEHFCTDHADGPQRAVASPRVSASSQVYATPNNYATPAHSQNTHPRNGPRTKSSIVEEIRAQRDEWTKKDERKNAEVKFTPLTQLKLNEPPRPEAPRSKMNEEQKRCCQCTMGVFQEDQNCHNQHEIKLFWVCTEGHYIRPGVLRPVKQPCNDARMKLACPMRNCKGQYLERYLYEKNFGEWARYYLNQGICHPCQCVATENLNAEGVCPDCVNATEFYIEAMSVAGSVVTEGIKPQLSITIENPAATTQAAAENAGSDAAVQRVKRPREDQEQ